MANPPNILIVEDEEALLQTLAYKLTKEGYVVRLARDGVQGLEAVATERPDLILLDILMPNIDGFGVLERLKEQHLLPELPVIIISNSGQPVEIDRAIELGARDYLVKADFAPDEVLAKVHAILGKPPISTSSNS